MKRLIITFILFTTFVFLTTQASAMIQDDWLKTVVLIEQEVKNEQGQAQYIPIGTGFLLQSKEGFFYVVTCRHVVKNKDGSNRQGLYYRLNTKSFIDNPFDRRPINPLLKDLGVDYFLHPNPAVDLALFPVKVDIKKEEIKFATLSIFEGFEEIFPGDDIFFIGYPIGTVLSERNEPVVRSGIISRKNTDNTFLIDGASFPGSSGSPVITKTLPYTYERDKKNFNLTQPKQARFIGIISQQVRYREPAISAQSGDLRVIFEENTGLSLVIPANFIVDILKSGLISSYEAKERRMHKNEIAR